jgi:hypothetical protein
MLLFLYAALFDLAKLAQGEQHGILTLLRLCHGTSFVGQAYPELRFLSRAISPGNEHNCARVPTELHSFAA